MKIPQPRILGDSENQQKLDHWKASFLLYYTRDESFQVFLDPDTRWFPDRPNYGFQQEMDGLERSPARLRSDLLAFFQLVASYLPNYYISSKIKFSTNMADIWRLIYRLYGAEITCDSFLKLTDMKKSSHETYRCFLERMVGHVIDHLTSPMVTIDELSSGPTGDKMNITIYNLISLLWLNQINPRLPKIVRTEYQRELREGTQLYALVDRLSLNIDNILGKHDNDHGVNAIQVNQLASTSAAAPPLSEDQASVTSYVTAEGEADLDAHGDGYVQYLRRDRSGSNRGGGSAGSNVS